MEDQLTMICVCLTKTGVSCDESGEVVEVGGKTHLFCCMKGFEQSLIDYQEHEKYANPGVKN